MSFPLHRRRQTSAAILAAAAFVSLPLPASAQDSPVFYIREYRVTGATKLTPVEIQEIVYPFLGPARTADDVEQARLALEDAFRKKGFQTASVLIPRQDPRFGIIRLEAVEGRVGRLRVHGAKWFLPSKIRDAAPSIAEGSVPDLNRTQDEIVALNRLADRKVTPTLRPGVEPGTVDIDLNVEDKLPLHGSIELNNRYSADTRRLRLNGALSYGNMFQRGDTLGASFQVAPEDPGDSLVYSAYYLSRINETLSLMLQGTKQESDVSTLGGSTSVVGAGEILGLRALFDLPSRPGFYQNFTLGLDWKRLDEETFIFGEQTLVLSRPIEYFPLSASYAATRLGEDDFTEFNLTATLHLRGLGSDDSGFEDKRYKSRGSFFHLRGDLSHTHDLAGGPQLFGKLQAQLSGGPLINSEQFGAGGLGNARGYLEAAALGDNALFATIEFRSPSLIGVEDENGKRADEWRLHTFIDAGVIGIYDALPGQDSTTTLAGFGFGTRVKYRDHFHGSADIAFPLIDVGDTRSFDPLLIFRGWADF